MIPAHEVREWPSEEEVVLDDELQREKQKELAELFDEEEQSLEEEE